MTWEKEKLQVISKTKLFFIIAALVLTGILIYFQPESIEVKRDRTLNQALSEIPGWKVQKPEPIEQNIVDALKLDDYINRSFTKNGQSVSLYIGFYNSAKKVGAAHDPVVCFPGQGWILSDKSKGTLQFDKQNLNKIPYSMMTATLGDSKQLILYWFQSYDTAQSNTFSQKIALAKNKIFQQGEANAFVRVITSLKYQSPEQAQRSILNFVESFYPVFVDYIKQPYAHGK